MKYAIFPSALAWRRSGTCAARLSRVFLGKVGNKFQIFIGLTDLLSLVCFFYCPAGKFRHDIPWLLKT